MASMLEPNSTTAEQLLSSIHQKLLISNCTIDSSTLGAVNSTNWDSNYTVPMAAAQSSVLPLCDSNFVLEMHQALLRLNNMTFTGEHNETGLDSNQFDHSRIRINYPHDMLRPSEINPSILPMFITHALTFLIGVVGNCVVIATWSMHGKFRSPTAVFLVSLAIADLLLMLVVVPLETLEYFMITWGGINAICKAIAYVEVISAMSTVLNLVAVSIERFLVIVYPMRARSWCTMSSTRKGLVIIWGLALILSTPVLLTKHASQITYYNDSTELTLYYCLDVENTITFAVAVYQLVVMFILPALFMVACYYVVIRQLWVSTRCVNAMTRAENQVMVHQSHSISSINSQRGAAASQYRQGSPDSILNQQVRSSNDLNSYHMNGLHRGKRSSWRRYLDLTHWWHQWRLKPSGDILKLNDLTSGTDPSRPQTRAMHNNNGTEQNNHHHGKDTLQLMNTRHIQWIGSQDSNLDSSAHSKSRRKCRDQLVCLFCGCWPSCDTAPARKMGDEVSECTMSSSYQMTSCATEQNYSRQRSDLTNSELQSPLDEIQEDDLEAQVFYVRPTSGSNQTGSNATRVDNHQVPPAAAAVATSSTTSTQNYSRKLANNVMEITRSRIQVIKMLALIVVLFLLCWGPRLIMNVLVKLGLPIYSAWIYNTRIVCNLLSFVHSALNPFVYGFMSSNFRAMVCSSFTRTRRKQAGDGSNHTASNNKSSRRWANNNSRSKHNSGNKTATGAVQAIPSDELPRVLQQQQHTSQLKRY